jgi:hypothetical protein
MEPALLALLTETIQHRAYTGQDRYGKPTYAAPVTRPARLEYRVSTLTDAQGQERTSMITVFCHGDFPITLRDHITLDDGTSPAIQAVYSPRDLDGSVHHHEIKL